MSTIRVRRFASVLCGVLGVLAIFTAVLIGYARRSVFDERAFAARAAASLENPHVADYVAERITDAVIAARSDLGGLRPVIVGVARGVVSSAPFRAAAKRGARTLHRSLVDGTATNLVLTVKDVGSIVESATASNPDIAKKIPPKLQAAIGTLETLPAGDRIAWAVRVARQVRAAAIGLLFVGIALCAASVALAFDKRWAIVRIGVGFTLLGLVLAIVARFGGNFLELFVRRDELAPVAAGLAAAFLAGLMVWAIALGLTGLVLASASASLLERIPLEHWGGRVRDWFVAPQPRMRLRLLRGVLAAAIGAALLVWPLPSLTMAGWFLGLLVAFLGLREGFTAALHVLPEFEPRRRGRAAHAPRSVPVWATVTVSLLALVLLSAVAWWLLRTPDAPAIARVVTSYNGLPQLGDRRLDQVMFATTHNSMGAPDVERWMFPNQSASIQEQLEDGIRGFMLDVHYGRPAGDRIKTEIQDEAAAMAKYEATLGKEGLEAAIRIRDRLSGEPTGERGLYLCHGFCELGALELDDALREMNDFLVENPGEVLVLIVQDEGVSPADIARSFEATGLIDFVYRGPVGPPWPTLRELVDTDQRVIVMTENDNQGVDWIHLAFDLLQETPYTFHDPSEFSNKPNRGGTKGSLALLNHWIETTPMPKPSNAAIVNARDALRARIRGFERTRGRRPNLVAVDFYREGDLIAVVQEYNAEPLPEPKKRRGGRARR